MLATLFKHNGNLYIIGINPTDVIIQESNNGGVTLSSPTTLFTGSYHTASTISSYANGRILKAVELDNGGAWGKSLESLTISAQKMQIY
ncbi:MAG: hypothetical protein R2757_03085 [Draconibacterium sp.]